jgi:nucleoporin POM152
VATADIVGRGDDVKKHTMWSCSGDVLSVDVEASVRFSGGSGSFLQGTGPFKIQYQKLWHDQAENVTVAVPEGITKLQVPLPDALKGEDSVGGQFKVSLMSIEDGNGCRRRLASPSVEVDVKRTKVSVYSPIWSLTAKPSVKFYDQLDKFHLMIAEGDKTSLPLRLAGKGPWTVTYTVDNQSKNAKTIKLYNPNAEIAVSQKGTYRLTEVSKSVRSSDLPDQGCTLRRLC